MNKIKKAIKIILDKMGIISICLVGAFALGHLMKWEMRDILIGGLSAYILVHITISIYEGIKPRDPPIKNVMVASKTPKNPLPVMYSDFDGDNFETKPKKKTMTITDEDIGESDPEYTARFLAQIEARSKASPPPSNNSSINISQVFDENEYYGEDY